MSSPGTPIVPTPTLDTTAEYQGYITLIQLILNIIAARLGGTTAQEIASAETLYNIGISALQQHALIANVPMADVVAKLHLLAQPSLTPATPVTSSTQ